MELWKCGMCLLSLPTEKFYSRKDSLNRKVAYRCRDCLSKYRKSFTPGQIKIRRATAKRWYRENRERILPIMRNNSLKNNYGIDKNTYEKMLSNQDGRCGICGLMETGRKRQKYFCVDHDHTTGMVRGLLCHGCNVGLGRFKDDEKILRKAIKYVRKFSKSSSVV